MDLRLLHSIIKNICVLLASTTYIYHDNIPVNRNELKILLEAAEYYHDIKQEELNQ